MLDLVPLTRGPEFSRSTDNLAKRIEDILAEVKENLKQNNAKIKLPKDIRTREKIFQGDLVMVYLAERISLAGSYSKLKDESGVLSRF